MFQNFLQKLIGQTNKYRFYDWLRKGKEKEYEQKRTAFYSQFLKKGDVFFDVGANVGNRIAPALNLGAQVVAFEPDKHCGEFLNIKFGNKITLIQKGLSDKEGELDMFISDQHSSKSSFSKEWIESVRDSRRFQSASWSKTVRIPMTTLDAVIAQTGIPRFIKIDVEGFELTVLNGLTVPVPFISFEYAVPEMTTNTIECIQRIALNDPHIECNYSVGESMEWGNDEWLSPEAMISFIRGERFIQSGSGDIYIRLRSVQS